ncbi:alpha-L-rhamnosidase C-terminal domain-containing protein [Streptomyces massasporeus]|uniref:alpha-L-rhamnosidase-related protein n=1 Tax=Streptomyces massasporeus TaxID=67324 RepID=UPI00381F8AD0
MGLTHAKDRLPSPLHPSWGYEIEKGGTTMWERWNSIMPDGEFGPVDMNSFNHYAYGAVGDWMFQNIGGLSTVEPGYKRSRIAPVPGGDLTRGSGSLHTVHGCSPRAGPTATASSP